MAGAVTAGIKLPSYSGSLGVATQWLVPELASIKLAWDWLWVQSSLRSNWPWFSTPANAGMWIQHIVFCSMVQRATQGFTKAQRELHHSSPPQDRIYIPAASSAIGEVYPVTREILSPQAASLSHHMNRYHPTGPQDRHLFARSLSSKTLMHRSE